MFKNPPVMVVFWFKCIKTLAFFVKIRYNNLKK